MKASKTITITLLTMSIAACSHKKKDNHPKQADWNNGNGNAYVSTDGNNYQSANSGFPIWLYWYLIMNSNSHSHYSGGAMYHYSSSGSGRGFHVSEGGRISSMSERGGFGSLGRASS